MSVAFGWLLDQAPVVGDWLWTASVRFAVLFLVAIVAARLARPLGLWARATVWRTALVAFLCLACVPSVLPAPSHWPEVPSLSAFAATEPGVAESLGGSAASTPSSQAAPATAIPAQPVAFVSPVATLAPAARTVVPWLAFLAGVWMTGLAFRLLRWGVGWRNLRRHLARAEPLRDARWMRELAAARSELGLGREVALLTSNWRAAPLCFGWWRPVVLLPRDAANWSPSRIRAVLWHELVHLQRGDTWFSLASILLRAVFWFHPAVRLATRECSRLQELVCDREVVHAGLDAIEYAEQLVALARQGVHNAGDSIAPATGFVRPSSLEERVRAVLADPGRRLGRRGGAPLVVLILGATLVSALAVRQAPPGTVETHGFESETTRGGVVLSLDEVTTLELELSADVRILDAGSARPGVYVVASDAGTETRAANQLQVTGEAHAPRISGPAEGLDARIEVRLARPIPVQCTLHRGDLLVTTAPESLRAMTSLGRIELQLPSAPTGPLELFSSRGSIHATLPRLDAPLHASTSLGPVQLTLLGSGSRAEARLASGLGDVSLRLADPRATRLHLAAPFGRTTSPPEVSDTAKRPTHDAWLRASRGDVRVTRID